MTDAVSNDILTAGAAKPKLEQKHSSIATIVFCAALALGLGYGLRGLVEDIQNVHEVIALGVFAMLGLALLIALGFEFVNGFHDTANAVATVIYTHSLPPVAAVVWSGAWNFFGVMVSSGAVAYSIVTLLPVELILQVGSGAGYAMIFALLLAAIIWNLGTWALGIPNSSSHALIGSVMGVGLANQLMAPAGQATSGVDWNQAISVFQALLFSPLIGFGLAAIALLLLKLTVRSPKLYEEPKTDAPPPIWIRSLLVATCTGVSFAHGSNDGQKGMGLIMLILIGAAPTAYALNRTMPASATPHFIQAGQAAQQVFLAHAQGQPSMPVPKARDVVSAALRTKTLDTPQVFAGLAALTQDIDTNVKSFGSVAHITAAATPNMRNDMNLTSEAIRVGAKSGVKVSAPEAKTLKAYGGVLQAGTRFIPTWVKVCVAVALGLGTMVGWKRIVVTVGEKIGKTHLTYAQGAAAELVAAGTILAADFYALPVSTTHILSSGVAGTMAANGSGLQWSTIRSIALAWVLTLPAAMLISGVLYFILRQFV
jgi:PiT family inorganic phosphate transporter